MGPLVATRVMANSSDIPTIPDIPIIIQICWCLQFQKGMTLDVCPNIINFFLIPTFLTFPPFLKFPQSLKSARGYGSEKVWLFKMIKNYFGHISGSSKYAKFMSKQQRTYKLILAGKLWIGHRPLEIDDSLNLSVSLSSASDFFLVSMKTYIVISEEKSFQDLFLILKKRVFMNTQLLMGFFNFR